MRIITIDVPELGNRSYIVHDGKQAIVIDPSRRIADILTELAKESVYLSAIFETHIHNDYVTGGFQLARETNAKYYISAGENPSFAHESVSPDDKITIGKLTIQGLHTPGHTFHHLSYLVQQAASAPALFSGGSLLYGAVGRPDLISPDTTNELAHAQYKSAKKIAQHVPHESELYPTHGFGSFCAATETETVDVSTIAKQLQTNHAYTAYDESSFVKELVKGLDAFPTYYAYMPTANLDGPLKPNMNKPQELDVTTLKSLLHTGATVIDLRSRTLYANKHLRQSINIEATDQFATYAGWLIDWDVPLILVANTKKEVTSMQAQLTLIGREKIVGQASSAVILSDSNKLSTYGITDFDDLHKLLADGHILDVRRKSETKKGYIDGAICIPLHELANRHKELPLGESLYIHCGSGFRASIAASILDGRGHNVTLINDDFNNAALAGFKIIKK